MFIKKKCHPPFRNNVGNKTNIMISIRIAILSKEHWPHYVQVWIQIDVGSKLRGLLIHTLSSIIIKHYIVWICLFIMPITKTTLNYLCTLLDFITNLCYVYCCSSYYSFLSAWNNKFWLNWHFMDLSVNFLENCLCLKIAWLIVDQKLKFLISSSVITTEKKTFPHAFPH